MHIYLHKFSFSDVVFPWEMTSEKIKKMIKKTVSTK